MGIHEKLFSIFTKVKGVQKDMNVGAGGGQSYKAVSEEQVLKAVRPLLVSHNVLVYATNIDVIQVANGVTTIVVIYTFFDVESDTSIEIKSAGQGKSGADKGMGMALTYSEKYLYLKLFKLITGEDPDVKSDHDHAEEDLAVTFSNARAHLEEKLEKLNHANMLGTQANYLRIKNAIKELPPDKEQFNQMARTFTGIHDGKIQPSQVCNA